MGTRCAIIGGGPAGSAAAMAAIENGADSVLLVERDAMGGTCTNRGCIPTKFLLSRTESFRSQDPSTDNPTSRWGRILAHKNALVRGLSKSIEGSCRAKGIDLLRGSARFLSAHSIEVRDEHGARTTHDAERFLIATGSRPAQIPGSPCDGRSIITSDDALNLDRIPESVIIVGSGAVGAEFAFIFTSLGVKVTLVEAAPRLFPVEDPEVDAVFRKVYERMGVTVHTGSAVEKVVGTDAGTRVTLSSGLILVAEKTLVGIGRSLAGGDIDCEVAGVDLERRGGVIVDDQLRTSQPHIFAAGDVTGRMLLAHAATYMGDFAGRKMVGAPFPPVPFHSIPWATFTTPEIGAVGLNVEAARRAGMSCESTAVPLMDSVKARIDRATEGFMKIVTERETGRIVGGTVVAPHASDLIHIVALAIHHNMTRKDLRGFCFAHPSIAELISMLAQ